MQFTNPTLEEALNAAPFPTKNADGSYKFAVVLADQFNRKDGPYTLPAPPYDGTVLGLKMDLGEIAALPTFAQNLLFQLMQKQLDLSNPQVLGDLQAILANSPKSLTALNAAATATVPASYAEHLWKRGAVVDWHDLQIFLNEQVSA